GDVGVSHASENDVRVELRCRANTDLGDLAEERISLRVEILALFAGDEAKALAIAERLEPDRFDEPVARTRRRHALADELPLVAVRIASLEGLAGRERDVMLRAERHAGE